MLNREQRARENFDAAVEEAIKDTDPKLQAAIRELATMVGDRNTAFLQGFQEDRRQKVALANLLLSRTLAQVSELINGVELAASLDELKTQIILSEEIRVRHGIASSDDVPAGHILSPASGRAA